MSRAVTVQPSRLAARAGRLALAAAAALAGACTHDRPLHINLQQRVVRPARAAVLLFVDGLGREQLDRHLAAGDLPNIDRYILRRGTQVRWAFSCLPTATYANTATFLTGLLPGHHGIVGNRWFDRYRLIYEDYAYIKTYRNPDAELTAPTLYDLLHERFTISIQSATRRGVTHTIDNWASSGINWFFGWITNVDKLTAMRFELIGQIANRVGRWPGFIHAYFPSLDEMAHRFGLDSPHYTAAIRNVDAQIGRICRGLAEAGLLESTYLVLVSDHGMMRTHAGRWIDLHWWLTRQRGLRLHEGLYLKGRYMDRVKHFASIQAVLARDTGRRASIYLRGPTDWSEPADPRLVDRLMRPVPADQPAGDRRAVWQLPGIGLAVCRLGPDSVRVINRDGSARIERTELDGQWQYAYLPRDGDPLGYLHQQRLARFVSSGPHTSRQWLAATATAQIPDFVGQIVELFDSPRAGDVVLFARPGWSFNSSDLAGHGSIYAGEMRVVMAFAGPGIPAGRAIDYARNSDVLPSVVELLGARRRLKHIGRFDGLSLVGRLTATTSPASRP